MSSMNNILNPCDRVSINLCSTGELDGFTNRLLIIWQGDVRSLCNCKVLIILCICLYQTQWRSNSQAESYEIRNEYTLNEGENSYEFRCFPSL